MIFPIVLGCVALLIISAPLIRIAAKRIIMAKRLKSVCKRLGYSLIGTRPLWFFSSSRNAGCDFYIIKKSEILCVKLFAVWKRVSTLVFTDGGGYYIRKYVTALPNVGMVAPINKKEKRLPVYNFRHKYRLDWELKSPRRVLLINPTSFEIKHAKSPRDERTICSTDTVNGYEISTLSRFISFYVEDITI